MSGSATALSSRDRVARMFERRDHDRIPRHDTYWKDTIARWQGEGLDGDACTCHDMLGSDFGAIAGSWPAPFPKRDETLAEDDETRTYIDVWGSTVRYWKNRSGTPEHVAFGLDSRATWEKVYKPIYDNLDPMLDRRIPEAAARYEAARKQGKWTFLTALESFESLRRLMGDVGSLMAMAEDPEFIIEVSRAYTDAVIRGLDKCMDLGVEPDGLWVYGDMAYNHATMCSPQMYRNTIWPDHKRLADWAHARGMKFIYHTDGDVNGVIDLYLEAGFDCLQPLEAKANMDVRDLCPNYGDRMAFFGNINVMTMGTNDRDAIEQEMRDKLEAGMAIKGYAYHSDHSVPPLVSFETYKFIIDLLDRYGNYT